jgi:hypothetical protein
MNRIPWRVSSWNTSPLGLWCRPCGPWSSDRCAVCWPPCYPMTWPGAHHDHPGCVEGDFCIFLSFSQEDIHHLRGIYKGGVFFVLFSPLKQSQGPTMNKVRICWNNELFIVDHSLQRRWAKGNHGFNRGVFRRTQFWIHTNGQKQ